MVQEAEQRADGQLEADVQPLLKLSPGPTVHADFGDGALTATDENCAGPTIRPHNHRSLEKPERGSGRCLRPPSDAVDLDRIGRIDDWI